MKYTPGFGVLCITFFTQPDEDGLTVDCDPKGPTTLLALPDSEVHVGLSSSFIMRQSAAAAAGTSSRPCRSGSDDITAWHSPELRYRFTRLITFFCDLVSRRLATSHRIGYCGQHVCFIVGLYTYFPLLQHTLQHTNMHNL